MRTLMIDPVLNGFIVKCGCQKVVFNSLNVMAEEIKKYFKNPEQVEKEYMDNAINRPGQPEIAVAVEATHSGNMEGSRRD